MMKFALLSLATMFAASSAHAQHYRNYEVGPNGSGGYSGTYGNQNFDIDTQYGGVSGPIGGRRPGVIQERPSRKAGSVGATQRNCVVDGNGNAICR